MVELGSEGRVVFVFQKTCPCSRCDGEDGVCYFSGSESLVDAETEAPPSLASEEVAPSVEVISWSRTRLVAPGLPLEGLERDTCVGGVPDRCDVMHDPPEGSWDCVVRFGNYWRIQGCAPEPDEIGCQIGRRVAPAAKEGSLRRVGRRWRAWVTREDPSWRYSLPSESQARLGSPQTIYAASDDSAWEFAPYMWRPGGSALYVYIDGSNLRGLVFFDSVW